MILSPTAIKKYETLTEKYIILAGTRRWNS